MGSFQWRSAAKGLRRLGFVALVLLLAAGALSAPASTAQARKGPTLKAPHKHKVINQPDFRWKAVKGASKYQLEVAQDRRFASVFKSIETAANRFIDTQTWPAASYWWRVRTIEPFVSEWSKTRMFNRRWKVLDSRSGRTEVARVDNVTVEDYSTEAGLQVPVNAIKISWDPVADASYYVVQFDKEEGYDPDLVPAYSAEADAVCITSHTTLTPNIEQVSLPEQGAALIADSLTQDCELSKGYYWVRIRAVDRLADGGTELYSLWSDEARKPTTNPPGPVFFKVDGWLSGTNAQSPASLTAPANGSMFLDAPVLEWTPVNWADTYKVVIALDRDFTTEVGHYYTPNTRFMPLERIPEDNAERSYYWYVVPCRELAGASPSPSPSPSASPSPSPGGSRECVSANQVVNRQGAFRSFKKFSAQPRTLSANKPSGAWTRFPWKPFSRTVTQGNRKLGHPRDSVGGIDYYEFQVATKHGPWPETGTFTDLPQNLPTDLPFGQRYKWRIRVIDGSGQPRPWSHERVARTRFAAAGRPLGLDAIRGSNRVTLLWRTPRSKYFPVTGYAVYYSTKGKRWKPLTTVPGHRATFKVRKGTPYWFMVTAINTAGEGAPSRVFVRR